MDFELRQLLREAQTSGDINAEARYLMAASRANQITDEELELASYLGYPAAELIRPYDIPYRLAKLQNRPPPNPPRTSWFCQPLEVSPSSNDIAHLWEEHFLFLGGDPEPDALGMRAKTIAEVAILLGLNFTLVNLRSTDSGPILAEFYEELRRVAITGLEFPALTEIVVAIQNWYIDHGGASHDYLQNIMLYLVGVLENPTSDDIFHPVKEALRYIIDFCIHGGLQNVWGEDLCQYLAENLSPFILGYRSLEETLPLTPNI
jgi:hypothetical protein